MTSYHNIFDLPESYTDIELKKAFLDKITNISKIITNKYEKEMYIKLLKKLYVYEKNKLSRQLIKSELKTPLKNYLYDKSFSKSYSSVTKNGETIVKESKNLYENGKKINTYEKKYKIDKDGNKIKLL